MTDRVLFHRKIKIGGVLIHRRIKTGGVLNLGSINSPLHRHKFEYVRKYVGNVSWKYQYVRSRICDGFPMFPVFSSGFVKSLIWEILVIQGKKQIEFSLSHLSDHSNQWSSGWIKCWKSPEVTTNASHNNQRKEDIPWREVTVVRWTALQYFNKLISEKSIKCGKPTCNSAYWMW